MDRTPVISRADYVAPMAKTFRALAAPKLGKLRDEIVSIGNLYQRGKRWGGEIVPLSVAREW
jgi:hypothetical protein